MIQRRAGARFPAQTLQSFRVLQQVFGQELKRYHSPQPGVFGLVDHSHAAAPNLAEDAVAGNGPAAEVPITVRRNGRGKLLRGMFVGRRRLGLHRTDEAVAAPRQGFDKPGRFGWIPQSLAQPLDRGVDAMVELDHGIVGPQLLLQLFPSDQFTLALQQHRQNPDGLFGDFQFEPALTQFSGARIEFKHAETYLRRSHAVAPSRGSVPEILGQCHPETLPWGYCYRSARGRFRWRKA